MSHEISKHPHWSRDEFVAFLLHYAADADMECTEEELDIIRRGLDAEHLKKVEAEYEAMTDFERISVIQAYRDQYFETPEQKAELLDAVENLFEADGEFDILEHNVYRMLQKIL